MSDEVELPIPWCGENYDVICAMRAELIRLRKEVEKLRKRINDESGDE